MLAAEKRTQNVIDKLLTLSQVRTSRRSFTTVDLAESVRDVVSDLDVTIDESGGRVECAELPTVEADAVQTERESASRSASESPRVTVGTSPLTELRGRGRPSS